MSNEEAVDIVMKRMDSSAAAERLAAQFAMDDIILDDVLEWIHTPVHENLTQFITMGRDVIGSGLDSGMYDAEQIMNATLGLAESMYFYAEIHDELSKESLSES